MTESTDLERDLAVLEAGLRQLEVEYSAFFSGQLPRPPWATRRRVDQLFKRLDRTHIPNYGDRYRFGTLQARFAAYNALWERSMRTRDEGRRPSQANAAPPPGATPSAERVLHITTLRDPASETGKLRELYLQLTNARRKLGETEVSYPKFVELVQRQVTSFRETGTDGVAFRLAVKNGRTRFVARSVGKLKEPMEEKNS